MMKRLLIAAIFLGLLAGCQTYALHGANKPRLVQNALSVTPTQTWNVKAMDNREVWTIDGEALQTLWFWNRLDDSAVLWPIPGETEVPQFKRSMTPNDVVDFVARSLSGLGHSAVETGTLRPAKVAGRKGFRFDMSFVLRSGTEQQAVVFGVRDRTERLSLVMFSAHPEFYFDRHIDEVVGMLKSAKLSDT